LAKIKEIILLVLVLLFIAGCKGSKSGEYTPTITSKEVYSGKEGLTMEFFENAPPKEIFENSVLPVGMRLYNKGAYKIEDGRLVIGLERDYMVLNSGSLKSINDMVDLTDNEYYGYMEFDLGGKDLEHPEGEHEIITFTAETKDLSETDPKSEYHDSLITITSCYIYQTKAVGTVCIDTDIFGFKQREKSCKVKILSLDSQGAPVAVTKIESEMLPSKDNPSVVKPRFTITVKNLGDGEVIKGDRSIVEGACSSEPLGYKEWNSINIKAYISTMGSDNKLDCAIGENYAGEHDDGTINLKGKEDKIRCTYEGGFDESKGTFSSPLYIILDYGYTDTISRGIKIKKLIE